MVSFSCLIFLWCTHACIAHICASVHAHTDHRAVVIIPSVHIEWSPASTHSSTIAQLQNQINSFSWKLSLLTGKLQFGESERDPVVLQMFTTLWLGLLSLISNAVYKDLQKRHSLKARKRLSFYLFCGSDKKDKCLYPNFFLIHIIWSLNICWHYST